jgi:hypothetical protein
VADVFRCGPHDAGVEELIADVGLRPVHEGDIDAIDVVDGVGRLWLTLVFRQGHQRGGGADVELVHHSDRGSQGRLKRSSQHRFAGARVGLPGFLLSMIWICECLSREAAKLVR